MATRNVPALTTKTTPEMWRLTNSQWSVYYWLLAHSYWNSYEKEGHYFIYRNSFTYKQIKEGTGIKSDNTIKTAFKKLEEVKALSTDSIHEAYLLWTPRLYVPMSISVIKVLLAFNRYIDPGILITMFAIICNLSNSEHGRSLSFTKTELGLLIGLTKQNIDNAGVLLGLKALEGLGLIKLREEEYVNQLKQKCVKYYALETFPKLDLEKYLTEDTAEIDKIKFEELKKAAKVI